MAVRRFIHLDFTTLLLGNSGAHGKNLSFFAQQRSLAVAPFYALVNRRRTRRR